jgi:hypothetical protein
MPTLKFTWHPTAPPNLRSVFDACVKQIAHPLSTGGVALVLPGMKRASQTHRHLAGRNSPKGEIVADGDGDTQIVSFRALDVLAWMTANRFCTVWPHSDPLHGEQARSEEPK